jgi:DNA-binding CsgD family transcriptional regulator
MATNSTSPPNLAAHCFRIGSDDFVIVSFDRPARTGGEASLESLTAAERDVLRRALDGLSTRAIAQERGTSPRTVAHQLAAIYAKLGVRCRRELRAQRGVA